MSAGRCWDLFCRVIDNYGDIGVCWRLAADLAARGEQVRLWVDDPAALRWMAPRGAAGVEVIRWSIEAPDIEPGAVVIEAFGCDPPPRFVDRMAARSTLPIWINLEYLSAQAYVERSHGLPSPQRGGLSKTFWYPGFTSRTGGLLREPALPAQHAAFERDAWLAEQGLPRRAGEQVVTLFCYDNPAIPALLHTLADRPTLLLLTPGHAQRQVPATALPANVRSMNLPWLTQPDYDRLLWSADLNLVRGEDSLVRAIWAGAPFLWQIYPQHDGAHGPKLDAFIDAFCAGSSAAFTEALRASWRVWNSLDPGRCGALALPPYPDWQAATQRWLDRLLAQADLVTQLLSFVATKR